jgi:amidase
MPTGRLADGLPVGLQIIGPFMEDLTTIRFAALAEQALGGFVPPPALVP